jgi:S1-C subfamily serine protease
MAQFGRSIFGSILVAAISAGAPLAALASVRPADRASYGAVVVHAHIPGEQAIGAGTIIAQLGSTIRVVTANHVAAFGTLNISFDDGTSVPARIVVAYPGNDIALIEATVDPAEAAAIHPAVVGAPHSNEPVRIWGSGNLGPALESGATTQIGADLPDGPANGRYALTCDTCHRGDSGGGIFDASGALVGVYVGYFEMDASRLSVAELLPSTALKIARSNTSTTPATVAASSVAPGTIESRKTPSTSAVSAEASARGSAMSTIVAAANFSK